MEWRALQVGAMSNDRQQSDRVRLTLVKAIHSAIFLGELTSILWLVVSGLRDRRDRSVALATVAVSAEILVFLTNDRVCPITPLAERYGAASGSVSDIWLPDSMARTIPIWSTALLVVAGLLHLRGITRTTSARRARRRFDRIR
jgi:hypothetical protein